ncbi:MAG: hypothetical protein HeimC2_24540 [Candidatus Heimdallarchaeota archaeon LC_2]|nr:MAG: hypothetical protein HeimC2_24540 [Candidatus Heimdallarchaeota archaeon LC_2]
MSNQLSLGLTDLEETVYKALLVSGQLTIGELRVTTIKDLNELNSTLTSLKSKKLIRDIPALDGRYACLLPLGTLKDQLFKSVDNMAVIERGLKQSSTDTLAKLQQELDGQDKQYSDLITKQIDVMNLQFETFNNKFRSQIETSKESVLSAVNAMELSNNASKEEIENKINDKTTSYEAKIGLVFKSLENKFIARTAALKEDMKSDIALTLETVKPTVEASVSKINEASNESVVKLNNIFSLNSRKFDEAAQSFTSQSKTHLSEKITLVNSSITETKTTITGLEENLSNEVNSRKISLDDYSNQITSTFGEMSEELIQVEDDFTSQIRGIEENLISTNTEINSKTTAFLTESNDKLASVTNELQTSINTSIDQELIKFKTQIEDYYQRLITETISQFDELKNSLSQSVDNKISEINSTREDTRLAINESLNVSVSSLKTTIDESSQKRNQMKTSLFANLKQKFESNKIKSNEILGNISSNIEGLINTIKTSTTNSTAKLTELEGRNNGISAEFEETQSTTINSNLTEALNEISNILGHELDSLNQLNEELANSNKTMIEGALTNIQEIISTKIDSLEIELNNFHNSFISNVQSSLDEESEQLTDGNSSHEEVKKFLNELSIEMRTFSTATHHTFSSFIESMKSDTAKLITDPQNFILAQGDILKQEGFETFNKAKSQSSANTANQVNLLKSAMDDYSANYSTSSQAVTSKTLDLASVLEKLFDVQESIDTPKLNTGHIVGKEAIMYQLENLLSRVKSKVTILVPSISLVNVDQILEMKSTAQVNVISYINEDTDKEWIDKMHSAAANVTLRSLSKSGIGSELPDFIGIEREGEEILLGTMDDSANEYVAIMSSSEYFVKILGNIVIADYARGKSRQLKK